MKLLPALALLGILAICPTSSQATLAGHMAPQPRVQAEQVRSKSSGSGKVHVRSYTKRNGTIVRSHTRSRPGSTR